MGPLHPHKLFKNRRCTRHNQVCCKDDASSAINRPQGCIGTWHTDSIPDRTNQFETVAPSSSGGSAFFRLRTYPEAPQGRLGQKSNSWAQIPRANVPEPDNGQQNHWGLDSPCPNRRVTLCARRKIQAMNGQQLEIDFEQSIVPRRVTRRQRRMARAGWWFRQMRQVVDRAWDWKCVPPASVEQVCGPRTRAR